MVALNCENLGDGLAIRCRPDSVGAPNRPPTDQATSRRLDQTVKRGAPDHWKMHELARIMKVPVKYGLPWANGVMERLWHYTAKHYPQGNIGAAPDWAICEACGWPVSIRADRTGIHLTVVRQFIDALVVAKWLDTDKVHRYLVHDWPEHADSSVKKLLKEKGLQFFRPTLTENQSGLPSLPFPSLPTPTLPNRAPVASDLNGQTSSRFDEFWNLYPRKQHKDATCMEWVSVVPVSVEERVFSCLSRYLASDEVARGVVANPEKWLMEQHRDGWEGMWPTTNGKPPAKVDETPTFYKGEFMSHAEYAKRKAAGQ